MRTNRPWTTTIVVAIEAAQKHGGSAYVDQVHKLARNYIASLDLGCPNLKMVDWVDNDAVNNPNAAHAATDTVLLTGKDRYLQWVKVWKVFYQGLSLLIRNVKKDKLRRYQLARLKETAQVMLSARHNAKLASWAIKMQASRLNVA